MQGGVIGQIQRVARAVRRIEMHGQQDVWRRLAHLDAEALHVFGQAWQRVLHAVLRQHLRHVEIGADPERHRHRKLAVAGGLAGEVQHVLDAVDLLLQRRRHRARNRLGRGARIGGRHLHGGRHDLRVLRDRQNDERTEADQGDEHAEDRGEDRPVDEEMGEAHGKAPVSALISGPAVSLYCQPWLSLAAS